MEQVKFTSKGITWVTTFELHNANLCENLDVLPPWESVNGTVQGPLGNIGTIAAKD